MEDFSTDLGRGAGFEMTQAQLHLLYILLLLLLHQFHLRSSGIRSWRFESPAEIDGDVGRDEKCPGISKRQKP